MDTIKKIRKFLSKYQHHLWLITILVIAALLRFIDLGINPPALNQDEAVNGYDAFVLGKTLRDHHGNFLPIMLQSFGDWVSPVLTYLTIPFVKIFGLSVFSVRMVTALFSVASVWLFYLLLNRLFNNKSLAVIGAFLLAISPWHITISRWAVPPSIVSFFLFLFLVTFFWALDKTKKDNQFRRYIIPGVIAGILVSTYPTQKLFTPLLVLIMGIIYLKKDLKGLLFFWLSFGLTSSPVYLLTLINPIYNSRFTDVSIFSGQNVFKGIISRYLEYFLPIFHFETGDTDVMHQLPGIGNSYKFLLPFFYLGMVICGLAAIKKITIKKIDISTIRFLFIWLLLFPLAASLTESHYMLLRVIHGMPLVIVFSIFCCNYLWQFINEDFKKIILTVVLLLGIFNVFDFSKVYFNWYPKLSFKYFQYGLSQSFEFLKENQDKFDQVVIDHQINQPYIFYLFFNKFDPQKLDYSIPQKSSSKYIFGPIPDNLKTAPIKTITFGEEKMFDIYNEDGSVWYLKKVYRFNQP